MTVYGYARVSTIKQGNEGNSLEAQQQTLKEAGAETIFSETYTGTQSNRPQLDKLFTVVEAGDIVIFTKVDRIARSIQAGLEIVQRFQNLDVTVRVLQMGKEDVTFNASPTGRLMFNMFLAFAQFERDMIVERTQEGKRIAATDPNWRDGRPKKYTDELLEKAAEDIIHKRMTWTKCCKVYGMSRGTLSKAIRAYKTTYHITE